jgi:hypothetical protein
VLDRFDESIELISTGIAAANRERQAFALDFFETWRGRQLFQMGRLADAAAVLEGRFDPAGDLPVVGALYAASVVALGRVAIHTGDEQHKRETAALARTMLADGTPANRAHGGWLLALGAMADGKPVEARAALDAAGSARRITPLYPMDVTDDPQLVRIAVTAGDSRLPPTPSPPRKSGRGATRASPRCARRPPTPAVCSTSTPRCLPRSACSSRRLPAPWHSRPHWRTWGSRSYAQAPRRREWTHSVARSSTTPRRARPGTRDGCAGGCGPAASAAGW